MRKYLLVSICLCTSACIPTLFAGAVRTGAVATEERSFGGAVDDGIIHTTITEGFLRSDVNDLLINVTVRVHEGRALLTGSTPNQKTAQTAVTVAWRAKGIKEVINEIQIGPATGIKEVANDSYLENQIEVKLIATKNIRSNNYTIEVCNAVAYIIGTAQDGAEINRVINVARYIKGVKRVVSHVRTKNDPLRVGRPDLNKPA